MVTKKELIDSLSLITDSLMPVMVIDKLGMFKVVFKDTDNTNGIDIDIDTSYSTIRVTRFNVNPYQTHSPASGKVRYKTRRWFKAELVNIIDSKRNTK